MRRFKTIFAWLFLHEIDLLLDNEALDVVYAIRDVTPKIKVSVETYIGRRINRAFSEWVDGTLEFRRTLRRTLSIVSGSVALQVIMGASYLCDQPNLDIYVAAGSAKSIIIRYLEDEELYKTVMEKTIIRESSSFTPLVEHCLTSVTRLQRTIRTHQGQVVRRINIFESDEDATKPVAFQDATWMMNWVGADEIVVGYPALTLAMEGVVNQSARSPIGDPEGEFEWENRFPKYRVPGFIEKPITHWTSDCSAVCSGRLEQEEVKDSMQVVASTFDAEESPEWYWQLEGWRAFSTFGFTCPAHAVDFIEGCHCCTDSETATGGNFHTGTSVPQSVMS